MIATLAKIASHTARGIFTFMLLNGGSCCRKELLYAGYPSTIIRENMIKLEVGGFVVKVTTGVYRVSDGIRIQSNGIPLNGESNGIRTESNGIPLSEPILESSSNRKYSGIRTQSNGMPLESDGIPSFPLTLVSRPRITDFFDRIA
jgi:hypothetical protein